MNLRVISSSVKAVAAALCTALALMLIFTFIALTKQEPEKFLSAFAYICLYISAVVCGYAAAKFQKSKAVGTALIAGTLLAFIIFSVSLFIDGEYMRSESLRPVLYALMLLCSAIGGVLGSSKTKKVKKAHRSNIHHR